MLLALGMQREDPPEDWLLKAWDGDVLIDLIFTPVGLAVDDAPFESADKMNVLSIHMPVMRLEDVFATKLMSLNDHYLDYAGLLKLVRAVREQVDWDVRERTQARLRRVPSSDCWVIEIAERALDTASRGGRPFAPSPDRRPSRA